MLKVRGRAYRDVCRMSDSLSLYVVDDRPSELVKRTALCRYEFREVSEFEALPEEAILSTNEGGFQSLFDDLWHMGYRATGGRTDVDTQTQAHIKDLRENNQALFRIVEKQIK